VVNEITIHSSNLQPHNKCAGLDASARTNATEGCEELAEHRLHWALLCVAATSLFSLFARAEASVTVTIKHGDSLDSLARKYHVSTKDIAHANGITLNTWLVDGKKLRIPDAPKPVVKAAMFEVPGAIEGDRITVHIGPNEKYRRLTLLDNGTPVTVTRKASEWYQIRLTSGQMGWVLKKYVVAGTREHVARVIARYMPSKSADKAKRHAQTRISAANEPHSRTHRRPSPEVVAHHAVKHHEHIVVAKARRMHYGHYRPQSKAPMASSDVVRTALAYRGVPYEWGGTSRRGFDCSGFTRFVYRKKGVALPHNAAEQFTEGKRVRGGHLKPGDLVFFHTTRSGISHVGIYAGKGKFVHASSGGGSVRVDSLRSGYYKERLVGARRVK
jgi:peptidoglycan endopeptidase LytF